LTHGFRRRPFSTAFLASSPAPTSTVGFDVFVHDVIEAITTEPCPISEGAPSSSMGTRFARSSAVAVVVFFAVATRPGSSFAQAGFISASETRS
jgi:hypothetical protein